LVSVVFILDEEEDAEIAPEPVAVAEPVQQPVQQAPVQQPVMAQPVEQPVQQPVMAEPVQQPVQQPIVQQAPVQQPVQQPVVQQAPVQPTPAPVAPAPVAQTPIAPAPAPVVEEPIQEAVVEAAPVAAAEPVYEQPVVAESVVTEPVAEPVQQTPQQAFDQWQRPKVLMWRRKAGTEYVNNDEPIDDVAANQNVAPAQPAPVFEQVTPIARPVEPVAPVARPVEQAPVAPARAQQAYEPVQEYAAKVNEPIAEKEYELEAAPVARQEYEAEVEAEPIMAEPKYAPAYEPAKEMAPVEKAVPEVRADVEPMPKNVAPQQVEAQIEKPAPAMQSKPEFDFEPKAATAPAPLAAADAFADTYEDEEVEVDDGVEIRTMVMGDKTHYVITKYNKSFPAKLSQCREDAKVFYNVLKNYLLSFDGVTSRMSWGKETFRFGKKSLVKIKACGNTIGICFALHPDDYIGTKYKMESVGHKSAYVDTPCLYRIENATRLEYCKELIDKIMHEKGAVRNLKSKSVDYATEFPYATKKELMERGLVKPMVIMGQLTATELKAIGGIEGLMNSIKG
ncbi:MAG: hypothetical protein K2G31_04085, partial [Clostridia bacterium]|nr:hypothetical protein [Clostridia bacterium]